MSEHNQVQNISSVYPPMPTEPPRAATPHSPSLSLRLGFILSFILLIGLMLTYSPELAQKIAYSWNLGTERAKAEIAKKLIADNPSLKEAQRIAWVAKAVSPSVVGLQTIVSQSSPELGNFRRRGDSDFLASSVGSGVIVDSRGYILTNYHVVAHAQIVYVQLSDGREVEARIVGQDRYFDLAVLQIGLDDLEAVDWGDSQQAVVGEQVIAIGSPYGLQQTVTSGIISATERYEDTTSMPQQTSSGLQPNPQVFMQTDAAINPGNSGGALVDMNGKLIGICTAIISEHGSNSGIGLVIPSYKAKLICDEIVARGIVKHGWIGVQMEQVKPFQAKKMNREKAEGVVVTRVVKQSPGDEAGLQRGDIILRFGETDVATPLHLSHLVLFSKPGTKKTVTVFRNDETLTLEITIGTRQVEL